MKLDVEEEEEAEEDSEIGDLVIVKGTSPENLCTGVIISTEPPESLRFKNRTNQKSVSLWADGGGRIDWESRDWLEVISESR